MTHALCLKSNHPATKLDIQLKDKCCISEQPISVLFEIYLLTAVSSRRMPEHLKKKIFSSISKIHHIQISNLKSTSDQKKTSLYVRFFFDGFYDSLAKILIE